MIIFRNTILFLLIGLTSLSAARTPTWIKHIRAESIPQYALDEDPDVVILRNNKQTVINSKGVFTTTYSMAMLIRKIEGFSKAVASVPYYSDTDRITSFNAWVLTPKDKLVSFKKDDYMDSIASNYKNIATTARMRSVNASGDVAVNSIFAFEAEVQNNDIFSQEPWGFQGPFPILSSTVSFEYPSGWSIEPVFFNMDPVSPVESKGKRSTRLSWIVESIPGFEPQPMSPSTNEVSRWAAFNIKAPETSKRELYTSWKDISKARTPTYDSLTVISPEMKSKVEELTSGSTNQLDTVRTLSELAQSINYISVALNLGKGGGYTPRPSNEVFKTKFGDCKDKTNLLQGLLKIKGIDLYPLIVYSGKTKIFENWPSSSQFNHCIAAIKIDESFDSSATIDHPELGKLLLFDPTSTFTPFGDLPYSLQGSQGLILAGDKGGLIDIPHIPLEKNLLKRDIVMELLKNGNALGRINEVSQGQASRTERRYAFTSDSDYKQLTKDWISENFPGAQISEPSTEDDRSSGQFKLEVEFAAPAFAKNMRNVLLIFKPLMLNRITEHPFGDEQRTQAVDTTPYNLEESIKIFLPEGFEISELPNNVELQETFGSYSLNFEVEDDTLLVKRSIKLQAKRVPLEDYSMLESFYQNRIKADQSTIVLERS